MRSKTSIFFVPQEMTSSIVQVNTEKKAFVDDPEPGSLLHFDDGGSFTRVSSRAPTPDAQLTA